MILDIISIIVTVISIVVTVISIYDDRDKH